MPSRLDAMFARPLPLAALWVACVAVVAICVRNFWIPLDEGTLAQSAERVLGGELPHRDFGDPYSGLGAILGSAAFRLFGVSLAALRAPLVLGFAVWLPAVWLVARRFAAPGVAAVATLLAATLSVLTYPAAMPTWYGLFLATWSVWLLLRFLDGGGRRWLLAAGAAAGVAVLFKVVGLYIVAATLLALAWHRADGSRGHRVLVAAGCAAFLLLLGRLTLPAAGLSGAYHFLLPSLALCGSVLARAWRPGPDTAAGGAVALIRDGAAVAGGLALPLVLFLVPYVASGSAGSWFEGVFILPTRRLTSASSPPGGPMTVLPGLIAVAVVAAGSRLGYDLARRVAIGLAALLALALALDDASGGVVFEVLWYSMRAWIPALTVWGALTLTDIRRWAVLALAALWTLVQFPYAAPAYLFYVAPLGVLATLAVAVRPHVAQSDLVAPTRTRPPAIGVGAVLVLVAAVHAFLGAGYAASVARAGTTRLDLERGGLRVPAADAALYAELVSTVLSHRRNGGLWAGPDAPEVYFLTGIPNRTPTLYEFLSAEGSEAPDMSAVTQDGHPRVIVVNTRPLFSAPLGDETLGRLAASFPVSREVGPFIVRWRAP